MAFHFGFLDRIQYLKGVTAFRDEIVDALYKHEAVADVLYDFSPDGTVEDFDIDFYLSFCQNLSDEN